MAYYAGMRRGELSRVSWGDIDLQMGVLCIKIQKAGRVDEVAIHPALIGSLTTARANRASAPTAEGTERRQAELEGGPTRDGAETTSRA